MHGIGKQAAPAVWPEALQEPIQNLSGLWRDFDELCGRRRPADYIFLIACTRKPHDSRKKLVTNFGFLCRPRNPHILGYCIEWRGTNEL
jgi:hypothetical protein